MRYFYTFFIFLVLISSTSKANIFVLGNAAGSNIGQAYLAYRNIVVDLDGNSGWASSPDGKYKVFIDYGIIDQIVESLADAEGDDFVYIPKTYADKIGTYYSGGSTYELSYLNGRKYSKSNYPLKKGELKKLAKEGKEATAPIDELQTDHFKGVTGKIYYKWNADKKDFIADRYEVKRLKGFVRPKFNNDELVRFIRGENEGFAQNVFDNDEYFYPKNVSYSPKEPKTELPIMNIDDGNTYSIFLFEKGEKPNSIWGNLHVESEDGLYKAKIPFDKNSWFAKQVTDTENQLEGIRLSVTLKYKSRFENAKFYIELGSAPLNQNLFMLAGGGRSDKPIDLEQQLKPQDLNTFFSDKYPILKDVDFDKFKFLGKDQGKVEKSSDKYKSGDLFGTYDFKEFHDMQFADNITLRTVIIVDNYSSFKRETQLYLGWKRKEMPTYCVCDGCKQSNYGKAFVNPNSPNFITADGKFGYVIDVFIEGTYNCPIEVSNFSSKILDFTSSATNYTVLFFERKGKSEGAFAFNDLITMRENDDQLLRERMKVDREKERVRARAYVEKNKQTINEKLAWEKYIFKTANEYGYTVVASQTVKTNNTGKVLVGNKPFYGATEPYKIVIMAESSEGPRLDLWNPTTKKHYLQAYANSSLNLGSGVYVYEYDYDSYSEKSAEVYLEGKANAYYQFYMLMKVD